jgi:hypothetical protein
MPWEDAQNGLLLADIRKRDYKDFAKDAILQGNSERFLQQYSTKIVKKKRWLLKN